MPILAHSTHRLVQGSTCAGPVRSGASCCSCASLLSPPWRVHLCSADEPPRICVPAGGLNSRACTSFAPLTTSGPLRNAGPHAEARAVHERPAAGGPSARGHGRVAAGPSEGRIHGSCENSNTRGAPVVRRVRTIVDGVRRCWARYPALRCQGIPLPRAVADLRHFLDAIYYEEICFLILRTCLATLHTGVFLYSSVWEKPFETHITVALLLGILSALTLLRVLCQYQVVKALSRLRWAWWQRTILPDFVKLLRSPLWQCQRILFIVSFSFYFIALHLAYNRGSAINAEPSDAPVLVHYVSLVVLVYLSVLGPHILMLVIVCTSLVVCSCASAADIEQLLVEEPRGAGRALPARVLQMMQEEQWISPERDHRRSRNINRHSGSSSSSTRDSDRAQRLDKQPRGKRRNLLAWNTRLSDIDLECSDTRRDRCGKRTTETRGADDNNEGEAGNDFICAICLTEFREGDVVRRLPCTHVFHSACITRWLSSHASCPLRCNVNFFGGHMNQPSYDARRCFRMLLRRRRPRLGTSLRQRRQRHVEQQRPTPRVQQQQLQPLECEGHQHAQDHQRRLTEEDEDERQERFHHRAEVLEVCTCVEAAVVEACTVPPLVERQARSAELGERTAPRSVDGGEQERASFLQRETGARVPTQKAPTHDIEAVSEGIGEAAEEPVCSEGDKKTVTSPRCTEGARIKEEENAVDFAPSRTAHAPPQEGEKAEATEEMLSANPPEYTTSMCVSRAACGAPFLRAALE